MFFLPLYRRTNLAPAMYHLRSELFFGQSFGRLRQASPCLLHPLAVSFNRKSWLSLFLASCWFFEKGNLLGLVNHFLWLCQQIQKSTQKSKLVMLNTDSLKQSSHQISNLIKFSSSQKLTTSLNRKISAHEIYRSTKFHPHCITISLHGIKFQVFLLMNGLTPIYFEYQSTTHQSWLIY